MANSYATHTELMNRLGLEENDRHEGMLIDVLEAASRWIDIECERRFFTNSTPETRYYTLAYPYGNGGTKIEIDDFVGTITLQTDNNGDGVYETTWTAGTDYWLSPKNAVLDNKPYTCINRTQLTGRYYFPGYEYGISVTGTFGYSTLVNRPTNIRELCINVALIALGYSTSVGSVSLAGSSSSSSSVSGPLVIPGVSSYRIGQELEVKLTDSSSFVSAVNSLNSASLPMSCRNIIDLYTKRRLVI